MASDKTQHKKIKLGSKYEVPTSDTATKKNVPQHEKNSEDKTLLVDDDKTVVTRPPGSPSPQQQSSQQQSPSSQQQTGVNQTNSQANNNNNDDKTIVSGNKALASDDQAMAAEDKTVVTGQHLTPPPATEDANDATVVTGSHPTGAYTQNSQPAGLQTARQQYSRDNASQVNTTQNGHSPVTQTHPDDITQLSGNPITSRPLTNSSFSGDGPRRATIRVGSILKERFELVQVLGSGGMGVVYKALDRRKQEASDRQPYVAVKVLNEEFRQHPESLVALQRESSKAQELAHPNIATVYDFDRENDVVFMTMEWLQGKALDELIREDYPDGMPMQKALKIASGVANGLSYAHKRRIIHSDFKPSNVFVLSDGTAKVFDFGIARAVSSQAHGEGEQTLFDAGQLGALTPAYASLEMLLGQEPDIRDDLYAFACVIYECLTGKHPFKKLSALKAREAKKQPTKIKQLSSNQWKALASALAFSKENRPKTVDDFIDIFAGQPKRRVLTLASILAVVILGVAPVGYNMVTSFMADQKATEVTRAIHQLPPERALEAFSLIENEEPGVQEKIIEDVKKKIFQLLEAKALQHVSVADQRFDFVGARNVISQGKRYYPDSAQLNALFGKLQSHQDQLINNFYQEFNELLDENKIYPKESERDVLDIIAVVRRIDPEHVMLSDPRLAIAYSVAASEAIRTSKVDLADKILATAILLYPDDKRLINLVDSVKAVRNQDMQAIASSAIDDILATSSIDTIKEEIDQLLQKPFSNDNWGMELEQKYLAVKSKVSSSDSWLLSTQQQMALAYLQHAKLMRQEQRYSAARNDLKKSYQLAPNLFGLSDEQAILKASEAAYKAELQASNREAQVKALKTQFSIQIKARDERGAERSYLKLRRLLGANDKFMLKDALELMAKLYYDLAEHHAKAGDYKQAIKLINKGLQYHPNSRLLLKAKETYRKAIARLQQDKINKQQQQVVSLYQRGAKANAKKLTGELKTLASLDKQVHRKVNKDIQHYYLTQINQLKEVKPGEARAIANVAKKVYPNVKSLQTLIKSLDPCEVRFAGHGKKQRATCYDTLANEKRGPRLVVIPKAKTLPLFAMTKYEISNGDVSGYCQLKGKCTTSGDKQLPATTLSVVQAGDYAKWLSQQTGFNYRLPTDLEWLHAIKTNKRSSHREFNCQVKLGNKLLKGQNLLSVTSGRSNSWGLMNGIGNAQEWVKKGNQLIARGGNYQDPLSQCNPELKRNHTGKPDGVTGFRLVREVFSGTQQKA